jgi:outer membrane protein OmpA-like peptidoglycan-associated protein
MLRASVGLLLFCSLSVLGCSGAAEPEAETATAPTKPAATEQFVEAPPREAKVTVSKMAKVNVEVTKTEVKINEKIQFAFRKATIEPASEGLIKEIADVLKSHPELEVVEVAGHADNVGAPAVNVRLTNERASAVVAALTQLGIDKSRLRAVGYGSYCPIEPGDGQQAREANRRVELKIVKVDGKETGAELGCPAATAKGIGPQQK